MGKNNGQRIYKWIMLIFIVMLITSLMTAFATYQYLATSVNLRVEQTTSLTGLEYTLSQFRSELEKKYIGEINDEDLIEGAIKGYVDGLGDPYTTYYTKEEMKEIMEQTNGNYVGIGIYMTLNYQEDTITIISTFKDSPAEKAGIMPGDIIVKVDGKSYAGDELDTASNNIKGEEGTKVILEILRGTETKTFEITREKITISHITAKELNDNIGYIAISDFEGGCADEFKTEYEKLKNEGIEKLIIDLRNNGGGLVDESLEIADMLIKKDATLLITKDKNENEEITKSKSNPTITMPVVVLTNEYSASASEILAGALKDNERGTLVGTTTYGKGVIQELHQLSDGSGLKITTNEYFTPNHNAINEVGITPDVEIDLSEETKQQLQVSEEDDTQLQKAIEVLKENDN